MSEKITMVPEAPRPWRMACKFGKWRIIDAEGYCVCVIGGSVGEMACGASREIAEHIILCVNEHFVQESAMGDEIVKWNWEKHCVDLSDGTVRKMTGPEAMPFITDAKTGEEITHVLSYDAVSHSVIRYIERDDVPAFSRQIEEDRELGITILEVRDD